MKKKHPLQDALFVATQLNMRVIPVHGNIEFGGCTCGNHACPSPGKHPVGAEWQKRASKDVAVVNELFKDITADYNYGIATGPESGVFVVDVDGDIGASSLKALTDKNGSLPVTLTCNTGNGFHLFFKYPEGRTIKGRASKLAPNIDIRANGNQVVGSGSVHHSGRVYQWENPLEDVADAPQWLIDLICEENSESRKIAENRGNSLNLQTNRLSSLNIDRRHSNEEVQEMLSFLDPSMGNDDWIHIGMALHDGGYPFSIWDDWSRGGNNYTGDTVARWKSFHGGKGVSMGTFVKMARDAGYREKNSFTDIKQRIEPRQNIQIEENKPIKPTEPTKEESVTSAIFEENQPKTNSKRVLPLVYADDITPITHSTDFVEDLLRDGEFSVIYGASNCGKTFFMLDLAMHVALGRPWRGKNVDQGGVIYAALEGGHGTKNRIAAFKKHYGVCEGIPLAVIPSNINFLDIDGDMMSLVAAIQDAQAKLGRVRLIVIDTLARAISGGDENASKDMGQLVINADVLREITGAHISFIHHSGKDESKGARGHSSLRAAVDTEIEISRPDTVSPSKIEIVKQREMEMIETMAFSLSRVVLGENQRGKEVSSCVVLPADVASDKRTKTLSAVQTFVYDAIVDCLISHGSERVVMPNVPPIRAISYDDLRMTLDTRGLAKMVSKAGAPATPEQVKSATQSARIGLSKAGKIGFNRNYVWLI